VRPAKAVALRKQFYLARHTRANSRCRSADSASAKCVDDSGEGDLDGESSADASFRFDVECSIDRCDSLPHSDKSEPATADLHLGETASVVLDRENHGSLPARQADVHGFRLGVLYDVRQSLLSDPEDGSLDLSGQSRASRRIELELYLYLRSTLLPQDPRSSH
jgi:hypothetical protein